MANRPDMAYWLLGDDRLALCQDPGLETAFKAHFVHSLLFNKALVLSDSLICNNRNLRHALRHDPEFRELVAGGNLKVAARMDGEGRRKDLPTLATEFLANGKQGFDRREYESDDGDLRFLEEKSEFLTYSLKDISADYDTEVFRLLTREHGLDDIPEAARGIILEEVARHREEKPLARALFHYDIGEVVSERLGRPVWEAVEAPLKQIADAPYLSALPKLIDAETVFAEQHRPALDRLRPRTGPGADALSPILFEAEMGLKSYVTYISRLTPDSIFRLRDSDEANGFHSALAEAKGDDSSLKDMTTRLRRYSSLIEKTILQEVDGARSASLENRERKITLTYSRAFDSGNFVVTILGMFIGHPVLNLLGLLTSSPVYESVVEPIKKKFGLLDDVQVAVRDALDEANENEERRDRLLRDVADLPDDVANRVKSDTRRVDKIESEYSGVLAQS